MIEDENPLLKALPPETDYLTYLTIVEYNLTSEQLPILHKILQDTTLTSNIGWDLVHLLLPLLPASEECLRDVARLGNPREVVLKVTELLEALAVETSEDDDFDDGADASDEEVEKQDEPRDSDVDTKPNGQLVTRASISDSSNSSDPASTVRPSPALKFQTLLSMLSILHPRIKTKYPSRFLSTTLQVLLPTYKLVVTYPGATDAVISFIKALSGSRRPKLPPRMSSTSVSVLEKLHLAPDPEANSEPAGSEEAAIQARLLQSILTHVAEIYVQSLQSVKDIRCFAWTTRLQEKLHPEKTIPGRETVGSKFAKIESLHERDATIGQLIALARDLTINPRELLFVVAHGEHMPSEEADHLPSSPSDISLSHNGSLYLLTAMQVSSALFDVPSSLHFDIFPIHFKILESFIGDDSMNGIGSEPEALIDSVLALGFVALQADSIGNPSDDESFNRYLQRLSLLSANTPSSNLRYHAHILVSSILHSHPSDNVRLNFIRDTLEYCPYENLKASAVGWLKDEILRAANKNSDPEANEDKDHSNIFATPLSMDSVGSFIFPKISTLEQEKDIASLSVQIPFFLAVLNLYYLLCISQPLRETLDISSLDAKYNIEKHFINPVGKLGFIFGNTVLASLSFEFISEADMASIAEMQLLQAAAEQAWVARGRLEGVVEREPLFTVSTADEDVGDNHTSE